MTTGNLSDEITSTLKNMGISEDGIEQVLDVFWDAVADVCNDEGVDPYKEEA